jgi:hypothetical protein
MAVPARARQRAGPYRPYTGAVIWIAHPSKGYPDHCRKRMLTCENGNIR